MARNTQRIGTFPSTMVVISLTIALFLIGICGWLVINGRNLSTYVKEQLAVYVFLEKDLRPAQLDSIYKEIAKQDFVAVENGSPQINFISREVAAKNFAAQAQEADKNFQEFLGENPLRDSYSIKVKEEYFQESRLRRIKVDLQEIPGVFEADYAKNLVDSINNNIRRIYFAMAGGFLLLLILIVILINNTIKLALYSQRFLIRSMQLVGATHAFIRKPFLIRGCLQGLMAGMVAGLLLLGFNYVMLDQIPELTVLQDLTKFLILVGGVLLLGILIGLTSTLSSVEKYLKISLDELY
jgi:cell division transport system permease protein